MHFTFIAETDIGTTKDTNQDSILVKHGQYSGGEVLMAMGRIGNTSTDSILYNGCRQFN